MIRLTDQPFDPGALLTAFCQGRAETGAVATFTGIARAEAGATTALELEAYPGFTEREIGAHVRAPRVHHVELSALALEHDEARAEDVQRMRLAVLVILREPEAVPAARETLRRRRGFDLVRRRSGGGGASPYDGHVR